MIRHGPGRFQFHQSERRWPSVIVSVAITALSFAFALGSMWSIPGLNFRDQPTTDAIARIQLPTPAPPRPVVKPPRVAKQAPAENQPPETPAAPAIIQPSIIPPAPMVSPLAAPVGTPSIARYPTSVTTAATDSGSSGSSAATRSGKGASMAPAGISLADRAVNTPQVRDSIARSKMEFIPGIAATREPTGRERAELEQSQRASLALRQRGLTAGNSSGLVVLQGKGMNGVGAVSTGSIGGATGVVASVPFTLFSSGPTREQRKTNDSIFADHQLRHWRLEDRIYLKRDSIRAVAIRADSIRADSIRADSLRRSNPSSP